jgi:hypothetical protein
VAVSVSLAYVTQLEARLQRLEDKFKARLEPLEEELDLALRLLRSLAAFLERTHGAEAVGPEVLSFIAALTADDSGEGIARIDALVDGGKEPEAVRVIREATGETWDQALQTYADWRALSRREKTRKLNAGRLRSVKAPQPPGQ